MDDFGKTYEDLKSHVEKARIGIESKEKCFPIMIIIGAVAPVLVWLVLYFLQPSFVQKKEGDVYVRNNTKVFYWTVLITLIIWVAMYLFSFCSGSKAIPMFCTRRL